MAQNDCWSADLYVYTLISRTRKGERENSSTPQPGEPPLAAFPSISHSLSAYTRTSLTGTQQHLVPEVLARQTVTLAPCDPHKT